MPKSKSKFKLISHYPVTEYQCGVRAGEQVKLRRDIVVQDADGKATGDVHHAGGIWMVLSGSAEPPIDVWLRQPDGKRHTWTDDDDFWNWFERVKSDTGASAL